MKDWKGNEIKPGDIVVVVGVRSMMEGARMGLMELNSEGVLNWVEGCVSDPIPRQFLWEPGPEYEILDEGNGIYMGPLFSQIPINHAEFHITVQPWDILCIKGVSDDKDEYYLNYFNNA